LVRQDDRRFGFTFAGVFACIAVIGWWVSGSLLVWAVLAGGGFAGLAIVAPGALMPLHRLWGWLAPHIASVTNAMMIGLVFYLFISPLGMFMRLFGRDALCREIDRTSGSYWSPVQKHADDESFRDQF
jgi:hypothetical protein